MVKISLSMAAGVLCAMLLTSLPVFGGGAPALPEFQPGGASAVLPLCCLVTLLLSISGALLFAFGERRSPALAVAGCFFLGAFCFFSRSMFGEAVYHGIGSGPLNALLCRIEETGFKPETQALMKALMCGDRSELSRDTVAAFRGSGASHVLALSGLHLGVIYLIAGKLLSLAGNSPAARIFRGVGIIAFCGFYAVITGASPSIVRAFLFILLRETLRLLPDRKSSPAGIYCAALTIQLTLNPLVMREAGFQLSYLAMAGIYFIYPVLSGWFPQMPTGLELHNELEPEEKLPSRRVLAFRRSFVGAVRQFWNVAAMSIACQLTTAPLAWVLFHTFPKYFLITNLISLPLSEALMVSGVVSLAIPRMSFATDFLASILLFCLETISCM